MEIVGAGLGDHAHLTAAAGTEFGRISARLDTELLHVLQARLQLERCRNLAVQVAGRRVDDRGAFDAVIANRVLFDRTSREADVRPRAGAGILRTWRLQHQLRHLASVDRQVVDLSLAEVDADFRGAQVEHRGRPHHRDRLGDARRLQLEVERQLLTDRQRHRGVFDRCEARPLDSDGVGRRLERGDQKVALVVRDGAPFLAGALVFGLRGHAGGEGAARITNDTRDAAVVDLREGRRRDRHAESRSGPAKDETSSSLPR